MKKDIDGDGVLNAAELLKAFEKIGQKPTLAQIQQMIEEIDTDKVFSLFFFFVLKEMLFKNQEWNCKF